LKPDARRNSGETIQAKQGINKEIKNEGVIQSSDFNFSGTYFLRKPIWQDI